MNITEKLREAAAVMEDQNSIADAVSVIAEALGVEEAETYERDLDIILTHIADRIEAECIPIPLDKDGEPIELLEDYYNSSGKKVTVFACGFPGNVAITEDFTNYAWEPAETLSKTPPDSQERIDEDKIKTHIEYWGCRNRNCNECPAKVDGKTPWMRYGFIDCDKAQGYDLALRQAALDAKGGQHAD